MKILVFGGLGFMGSNFVNWTMKNKPEHELVIADGFTYAADEKRILDKNLVPIHRADLREPSSYESLVEWSDVVVNFAAETHNDNSLHSPQIFFDTNVMGLVALMGVCVSTQTKLVQISTDEVFGDFPLDSEELATEEYPFRPSSPYSSSKAAGDLAVQAWIRSFGLSAIVTHCTNNFGPGQHPEKLIPNVIDKIKNGIPIEIYGDGMNLRDWIHVDDHTTAVWTILENGNWGEVYNISAYAHLTNLDVVNRLRELMRKPEHPVVFVKDRPGHDLRYGLDSSVLRVMGWTPSKSPDFSGLL